MTSTETEQALEFLKAHQPMPPETEVPEEDIRRYESVRRHFELNPVVECIPLFLHSFQRDAGLGVYQMVEDVLLKFPPDVVIPYLIEALYSANTGSRFWAAQFASSFPDKRLVAPLCARLRDDDAGVRLFAADALDAIGDPSTVATLEMAMSTEKDEQVRDLLSKVLIRMRNESAAK